MKYDFDSIVKRENVPYSYSAKWATSGAIAEILKKQGEISEIPADRLCFFVADMDFKCAPEIVEAMHKTAEHGIYGYSAIPDAYYQAVCRWFHDRFAWDFNPENIIVSGSGTHSLVADCVKKLTQPGDGIIVPLPSYGYHFDIEPNERKMVGVPMKNDNEYYTFDFDALEEACKDEKNTLMIMMQPHNPTGRVFTEEEIRKVGEICRRNNVIIVSDEVHIDIARAEQKVVPVMKVLGPKGVISTTAINKTFNVAGLAMSNMIVEDPELREKLQVHMNMANPFGISAVIAAYTQCDEWVDELNAYLDKTVNYAVERIKKDMPKVKMVKPEGTYVLWLDFSGYGLSDDVLTKKISDTHVLLQDGTGFDAIQHPRQYRRICLTAPMVQVKEMCDRLADAFKDC